MTKEEVIELIKEKIDNYMFQSDIEFYVKGFLDALCKTYEITWEERYEIEEELKDE